MSLQHDTALGKHLHLFSNVTLNPVSVHLLSGLQRGRTVRLSKPARFLWLLDRGVCNMAVSSGATSDVVDPYRYTCLSNSAPPLSIFVSLLSAERKPSKICQWSVEHPTCFAFKVSHTTWTQYETSALHLSEVAILPEYIFTSLKNDSGTSLSLVLHKPSAFPAPLLVL